MSPPEQGAPREAVVLVHGIWMRGGSLFALARWLKRDGFTCHSFTYSSVRCPPAVNAARLQAFAARLEADTLHFVGHSLGGIVLLHLFERFPDQRPGRVVLLGSPVRGSGVAQRMRGAVSRLLLGQSTHGALLGGTPRWRGARALGVIAGTRALGIGRVLGGLSGPNDGTVAVRETRIENAADHLTLPVSHSGLVLSRRVAVQIRAFLREGRFERG